VVEEGILKIGDVVVVDFEDGDGRGEGSCAVGAGEGGDGMVVFGEEGGEDVMAYVSCCLCAMGRLVWRLTDKRM
jgi:hypothetical protein